AARVSQRHGRPHVTCIEHVLDRQHARRVAAQQLAHAFIYVAQARGQRIFRLCPDDAAFHERHRVGIGPVDDAVSGDLSPGIDAQDDHALAAMSATSMSKFAHTFCTSSISSTSSMSLRSCSAALPSTFTVVFGTITTGSTSTNVIPLASTPV